MSDPQQNRRLEAVNGSEPYAPMAGGRTPIPKRTWWIMPASRSPSLGPSPRGRGRILLHLSANATVVFARLALEKLEPPARCSLSLRERARVRGIRLPIQTRTPRMAGIVELCQSPFRTGGAL